MIKVSIVEDIKVMRETLQRVIEGDTDLVLMSKHATLDDALAKIPVHDPDIVLLDINLNGKNGIELIRKVKETNPTVQFLMCTALEDDESVFDSLKAGASGYILKRAGGAEIRNAIKDLFHGGSPMSPDIARRVVSFFSVDKSNWGGLTDREFEILKSISNDATYKEVADQFGLTHSTIRNHLHNIYKKLHVKNKSGAIDKFHNRQG